MVDPPKTTLPKGTVLLDRYELGELLGSGGMGDVYGALDQQSDRKVAIKVLKMKKHLMSEGAVVRFEREAKATAGLGHPNIIQVMDFHRTEAGTPFLVMEFLVGESLGERLEREEKLPVEEAVHIHVQVLRGLQEAHAAGVVHRDVKPDNTFLLSSEDEENEDEGEENEDEGEENEEEVENQPVVKVLDFGLAYLLENKGNTKLTKTGMAIGTPSYMAPERLRGELATNQSDIYSVGVSLFQCITGTLPFPGDDLRERLRKALHDEPPKVSDVDPEVDPTLSSIVGAALAKRVEERFLTAADFIDLLERWQKDPDSVGPDDLPVARSMRPTADAAPTVRPAPLSTKPPPPLSTKPPPQHSTTPPPELASVSTGPQRSPVLAVAIVALVLVSGVALWWTLQPETDAEPETVPTTATPPLEEPSAEPTPTPTPTLEQAEVAEPEPATTMQQAATPRPRPSRPAATTEEVPEEDMEAEAVEPITGALQEPEW